MHREKRIDGGFIVVKVLLSNNEDKYILVQRDNNLKWEVPGGGFEVEDEKIVKTAIREFNEETGLDISDFENKIKESSLFLLSDGAKVHTFYLIISEREYDQMYEKKTNGEQKMGLFSFEEISQMWKNFKNKKNPKFSMGWSSFKRSAVVHFRLGFQKGFMEDDLSFQKTVIFSPDWFRGFML